MKRADLKKVLGYFVTFIVICLIYYSRVWFGETRELNQFFFNEDIIYFILSLLSLFFIERQIGEQSKKIKWFVAITIILIVMGHLVIPDFRIFRYILLFYFMMLLTFTTKRLTKRSFSVSIGIMISFLLMFVFVVAVIGLLPWLMWILVFISLVNILYIYRSYNHKKEILIDINEFINVEFVVFSVLFMISIVSGMERYVHSWDEYNMWALNAKKIIVNDSLTGFVYPPILSIWYYISHIFIGYSEPNLYISHAIFINSFVMILFSELKDKKMYFLVLLLVLAIPHLFAGGFNYNNLYADFPSTILFMYGMIYFYQELYSGKQTNWIKTLPFYLVLILISLIKPQGFVLSFTLGLFYVGTNVIENYKWRKGKIKANCFDIIKKYLFILVLPVLAYGIWIVLSNKLYSVETFSSPGIMPPTLNGTFIQNFSLMNLLEFCLHVVQFLDENIIHLIIDISYINFLILSLVIVYVYYFFLDREKNQWLKILPLGLCIICFYGLICLSMLVMMTPLDALALSSFGRYLGNFNVGLFVFLIWLIAIHLYNQNKISFIKSAVIIVIIVLSVPITQTFSFITDAGSRIAIRNEAKETMSQFDVVLKNTKEEDRIYVIDQQDKNGNLPMCLSMYYLYPRFINANGTINWKIVTDSNRDEIGDWALSVQDFENLLIENDFDYVFLYSYTDELFDEFNGTIEVDIDDAKDYRLFKIKEKNGSITLVPVE